jgi:hypothetical protein
MNQIPEHRDAFDEPIQHIRSPEPSFQTVRGLSGQLMHGLERDGDRGASSAKLPVLGHLPANCPRL